MAGEGVQHSAVNHVIEQESLLEDDEQRWPAVTLESAENGSIVYEADAATLPLPPAAMSLPSTTGQSCE
jgi:hypothetical protein